MTEMMKKLQKLGIVPVVVLNSAEDALPLAERLVKGGLPCAEVTFRTAAAEESTLASRYEDDMARYQTVIDGLQDGQAYGFADISDVDVLLVADHVYDNLDGNMVAMKADVYCINGSDEVVKYGTVESTDSAYPLYVTADKCLMFGGNHKLTKVYVDIEAGAIITFQEFTETFNADGEATYHYLSMDEGIDEDVEDDSAHVAMLEQYETGTPVNFTTVGEAAAAAATN